MSDGDRYMVTILPADGADEPYSIMASDGSAVTIAGAVAMLLAKFRPDMDGDVNISVECVGPPDDWERQDDIMNTTPTNGKGRP